ncbi:Dihydrolipoyl dehydrogenase [Halalkalibacter krulwichiae]|uniref:Dihydrolipoyl dehydrogenase n=3 Tax=Halalkalibacter krulwichiae TaxID=199441 RepID=A0A1X9M8J6_9BACI|nr:Dihydrolipoyl dehydrogenase [Halalkalibacter krulwichiae]
MMKKNIIIPKAGLTMTEATIEHWMVDIGDYVMKDQAIAEILTEKMIIEVTAPEEGTINSIIKNVGDDVKVGDIVATMEVEGEERVSVDSEERERQELPVTNKELTQYTVAVIGGGPGGYTAAIRAAQLGGKVVLIERENLGGVCLNSGCIPTKTVLKGVEFSKVHLKAAEFGVRYNAPDVDFKKLMEHKGKVVTQLRKGVSHLLQKNEIDVINGTGKVLGSSLIEVTKENGEIEKVSSENIILATGSKAAIPNIEGIHETSYMTSEEALKQTQLPESIAIVGAGAIGCEFAGIYAPLGVKVTLIESSNDILPGFDNDVVKVLKDSLRNDGVTISTSSFVTEIVESGNYKKVLFEKDGQLEEIEVEEVLVATGRKPNIDELEGSGLHITGGKVTVDEKMRTNISNIYAVGDVTGKHNLAHVAATQGIVAAENCMNISSKITDRYIPVCIYTSPEIASIGLSETEAKQKGINFQVGKFQFNANGRALSNGSPDGFVKVLREEKYNQILGVQIVGECASELISEATLALNLESTTDEISLTIHAHPTLSEGFLEAVLASMGKAIHS